MILITKPQWPFVVALGVLFVLVSLQLSLSIRLNENHFVYALDDPYIHMAIARNFARHGIWGVTRYEFSSSTSSLLWTLILAVPYRITLSPYVPLLLNIICAVALLFVADSFFRDSSQGKFARFFLLVTLILFLPMPALVLSGMEHIAHALVSFALICLAAPVIANKEFTFRTREAKVLLLLAGIAPLVRYESVFFIALIGIGFLLRRRVAYAFIFVAVAAIPLLVYGLISWKQGSFFLPNSLLLKGSLPQVDVLVFLQTTTTKLKAAPQLWVLWLLALSLLFLNRGQEKFRDRDRILLLLFMLATVLHILFAAVGWFYRYEAYLVALGWIVCGPPIFKMFSSTREKASIQGSRVSVLLVALSAMLSLFFLADRANRAMADTVRATRNIYQQQYQMATFLKEYYSGVAVAANDIGAINFLADIRCVDLWGLGSAEVTRLKLAGEYNTEKIDVVTREHQVQMALIYSAWFDEAGGVPAHWIKVGQWSTPDCVICGNPEVSFYAVDAAETENLIRNLQAFSKRLPAAVTQTGLYTNGNERRTLSSK